MILVDDDEPCRGETAGDRRLEQLVKVEDVVLALELPPLLHDVVERRRGAPLLAKVVESLLCAVVVSERRQLVVVDVAPHTDVEQVVLRVLVQVLEDGPAGFEPRFRRSKVDSHLRAEPTFSGVVGHAGERVL